MDKNISSRETVTLQIDSIFLERIIREEARALLIAAQEKNKTSNSDGDSKYMTRLEFLKYTNMSWNTIQKEFFFNEDFKPHRTLSNNKWRFDRIEATAYFDKWLETNKKD
ncbi:hypothetical protein HB904_16805 [Listeria booriae]|uniref:DUF771 domain-containing protein n=1 Tax=Listeria booriae TaxID=1552123 RepID=A0A841YQM5_9LIST|nr:hypothetical protein [Listeria booriae]MBC1402107.1 hypothetical protein [Listeria booriae]MBC1617839.1 hypothetical protein [Listeria booriae]